MKNFSSTYTLNGNFGSEVNVILNVTLPPLLELAADAADESPEIESDLSIDRYILCFETKKIIFIKYLHYLKYY